MALKTIKGYKLNKKIIAVDVDLTVVDTLTSWLGWYKKLTGHDINIGEEVEYNIETLMHKHSNPLAFWKLSNLYDNEPVIPEAKNVLDKLNDKYDIIFVSSCFPEHYESKQFFIQRNFPYNKGFISTSNKGYIKCDVVIDDYYKYLDQFDDSVIKFMIKTDVNKNQTIYNPVSWNKIYEELM